MKIVRLLLVLAAWAVSMQIAAPRAWAQDAAQDATPAKSPRYGMSLNALYSTPQGVGLGIRGRASMPITADISTALDLGFTGFVLEGWRGADYLFEPQISLIITPPPTRLRAGYIFLGMGGYLPLAGNKDISGPTIHIGLGRAHGFGGSAVFYEINPALIIGGEGLGFVLPVRIGIIF